MHGYTYLLASKKGGTLYCGVTSDLSRRVWEHKEGLTGGFTTTVRRETPRLVRGVSLDVRRHQAREAIKSRPRAWKIALIEEDNPDWRDLSSHLVMF